MNHEAIVFGNRTIRPPDQITSAKRVEKVDWVFPERVPGRGYGNESKAKTYEGRTPGGVHKLRRARFRYVRYFYGQLAAYSLDI